MEITEFKTNRKHFSKVGLVMFFGTLIIYGVQLLATVIIQNIPAIEQNADLYMICTMLPTYAIAYPLIFLMFKIVPADEGVEKKKMKVSHIFIAFAICYAGTYLSNLVGTFITTIIGIINQKEVENVMVNVTSQISLWCNFLIVVVAAPIMEELLFRKFLIDRMSKYGQGVAVFMSGLLFGLFHGNLNQFMYAFLIGVLFGFIYVKTRNIIYTIIMHMITNFIGGFVSTVMLDMIDYYTLMELTATSEPEVLFTFLKEHALGLVVFMFYSMVLMAIVVFGIVMFFVNKRKFTLEAGEVTIEKGQRFKTVILNLGMMLFCIFWIAMIIMQLFGVYI